MRWVYRTPAERILQFSIPVTESGCWLWLGAIDDGGYGRIHVYPPDPGEEKRRTRLAHRVSFVNFVGDIPEPLQIDHLCRVRCCVNPPAVA